MASPMYLVQDNSGISLPFVYLNQQQVHHQQVYFNQSNHLSNPAGGGPFLVYPSQDTAHHQPPLYQLVPVAMPAESIQGYPNSIPPLHPSNSTSSFSMLQQQESFDPLSPSSRTTSFSDFGTVMGELNINSSPPPHDDDCIDEYLYNSQLNEQRFHVANNASQECIPMLNRVSSSVHLQQKLYPLQTMSMNTLDQSNPTNVMFTMGEPVLDTDDGDSSHQPEVDPSCGPEVESTCQPTGLWHALSSVLTPKTANNNTSSTWSAARATTSNPLDNSLQHNQGISESPPSSILCREQKQVLSFGLFSGQEMNVDHESVQLTDSQSEQKSKKAKFHRDWFNDFIKF